MVHGPAYDVSMSRSLKDAPHAPAVLDVEASGFGRNSYPIEVGFVLPNGHSFCCLIYPEPEWTHWDPQAETVHHISRTLLLKRGLPAIEVARLLNAQLIGQTVYSDGWANDYSCSTSPGFPQLSNWKTCGCCCKKMKPTTGMR